MGYPMDLCRLIAEFISLITSRVKRRKYIASGVVVREVDQSDVKSVYDNIPPPSREPVVIRSKEEFLRLYGSPNVDESILAKIPFDEVLFDPIRAAGGETEARQRGLTEHN